MPGRTSPIQTAPDLTSSGGKPYRYGFNGKESDFEVKNSGGSSYDYGLRIYDPRLGRFLSVDPLEKQYAWNSPYSFATNRVIDGVDLDGLEYLSSEDARVQFINGRLELKLENMHNITHSAYDEANKDIRNWVDEDGNKTIGMNPTVENIMVAAPEVKKPELSDMPDLRKMTPSATNTSPTVPKNPSSSSAQGAPEVSSPEGKGIGKVAIVVDAVNFALSQYVSYSFKDDKSLVDDHTIVANQVIADMKVALKLNLIPPVYQNTRDMVNIMNVVLQGVNNTTNKEIYDIGMKIYNTIHPNVEYVAPMIANDNTTVVSPPPPVEAKQKQKVPTKSIQGKD